MTLPIAVAEQILRRRLGEPVKPPTGYVIGFKTHSGRVLALHREANGARIWFLPPAPAVLDGVTLIPNAKNSNLNGPLETLNSAAALRAEIATEKALDQFLDWYAGFSPKQAVPAGGAVPSIDLNSFRSAFHEFQRLIANRDKGRPFRSFQEGMAAAWEDYKPKLQDYARKRLALERWSEEGIGSGVILRSVIEAIEIQDNRGYVNNLVFWQNRFGHGNRDHRVLLEAQTDPKLRKEVERLFFDLYITDGNEGVIFDSLRDLTGGKYPLLAYLYFLKDMDRFMPIQPTGFDRVFRLMGIDFSTLKRCGWDNYSTFNGFLRQMIPPIEQLAGLKSVRLVDAHSFCWILTTLVKMEATGELSPAAGTKDDGHFLGAREKSIIAMRMAVENTVRNANGQLVQRTVKNKELRMTSQQLERCIALLLGQQGNRCALTGIPFQYLGQHEDKNLLPSLDRIDSNGHYEEGNLQVVCQFINFWKSDSDNEQFKQLLNLVRGVEE
ncbi:hypothetical protein GOL30_31280 [Sinorhizobium medicae]|nr:hypothetical protein [Sinorhizobium medicae]MDX0992928.1 hypothetical protein [Sinorhizobium medicae]MDX1079071.1 hypothetical protein [Sinorhizobium medicae]